MCYIQKVKYYAAIEMNAEYLYVFLQNDLQNIMLSGEKRQTKNIHNKLPFISENVYIYTLHTHREMDIYKHIFMYGFTYVKIFARTKHKVKEIIG